MGIKRIQRCIHEGIKLSGEFARRFSVESQGDPRIATGGCASSIRPPYGAYLNTPMPGVELTERFLHSHAGMVETRPIKGTCPRGLNPVQDLRFAGCCKTARRTGREPDDRRPDAQ